MEDADDADGLGAARHGHSPGPRSTPALSKEVNKARHQLAWEVCGSDTSAHRVRAAEPGGT